MHFVYCSFDIHKYFYFQHHCRKCGEIFCGSCSETSVALEGCSRPVRVCDKCSSSLHKA